jgi:hypothetical protein
MLCLSSLKQIVNSLDEILGPHIINDVVGLRLVHVDRLLGFEELCGGCDRCNPEGTKHLGLYTLQEVGLLCCDDSQPIDFIDTLDTHYGGPHIDGLIFVRPYNYDPLRVGEYRGIIPAPLK